MSNPCFDLWLLLHFTEFPDEVSLRCSAIGEQIQRSAGRYDKTNVHALPITDAKVLEAIRRAKARPPQGEIPSTMSTAIHLIVEPLIERWQISVGR